MKALTLYDPWATLIALGEKRFETRSWATSYRGPLAIHVSKHWSPMLAGYCHAHPYYRSLARHMGADLSLWPLHRWRGCVIAIVELVDCWGITPDGLFNCSQGVIADLPQEPELSFGDFTAGRYAWKLDRINRLKVPIRAKGNRSLWNWTPTDINLAPAYAGGRNTKGEASCLPPYCPQCPSLSPSPSTSRSRPTSSARSATT